VAELKTPSMVMASQLSIPPHIFTALAMYMAFVYTDVD
jgi:hypothetical protein